MTAACYIRVSTDDQTEYSPDAQLREIKDYCNKHKIELLANHIYIDEGISGKSADKRPEFQRMIAMAKQRPKPFDAILIHKFDRFARDRQDAIVYKSLLRKKLKIEVISIKEDVGTDKNGMLLEGVLDVLSEYYSLNLADEVKKGQIEKVLRGGNVSKPPYGYKTLNKELIINREEAKIIKLIFELSLKNYGCRKISKSLEKLRILSQYGKPLSVERIKYILANPIYAGYVRRNENGHQKNFKNALVVKGIHEPIINEDMFNKVQKRLDYLKGLYDFDRRCEKSHWLNGLLRCSSCGKVLVRYTSRGITYYQCSGYFKAQCGDSHCKRVSKIEDIILDQIKIDYTSNIKITTITKDYDNEINILKGQLQKCIDILERIKVSYENGIDSLEEYRTKKLKLKKDISNIETELKKLENNKTTDKNIKAKIGTIYEILKNKDISMEKKHIIAHELIKKIVYNKKEETLFIFYNNF